MPTPRRQLQSLITAIVEALSSERGHCKSAINVISLLCSEQALSEDYIMSVHFIHICSYSTSD